jgi:hypothetical protein
MRDGLLLQLLSTILMTYKVEGTESSRRPRIDARGRSNQRPFDRRRRFLLSTFVFVSRTRPAVGALCFGSDESFVAKHAIDFESSQGSGPERHDGQRLLSHLLPMLVAHRSLFPFALFRHS